MLHSGVEQNDGRQVNSQVSTVSVRYTTTPVQTHQRSTLSCIVNNVLALSKRKLVDSAAVVRPLALVLKILVV